MKLSSLNNLADSTFIPQTYLNTIVASGGGTLPVKNINGFTDQYAVQVGKTGEGQAEMGIVSGAPSGSNIILAGTLRFSHGVDTPIYQTHYDKVIFKRSTAGTAGTASALSNGTIAITPNLPYTEFNDTTGASTYAYKTQFYNSVSGDLSAESDWFIPGGGSFYSLQRLRDRGRNSLYTSGYVKDNDLVNDWINEWCEMMTNAALKANEAYSAGTAQYAFGTAGLGTITEPLFKYAAKVELSSDGRTWIPSDEIPLNSFSDLDLFNALTPRHYWQGDTVFGVLPVGNMGTARMTLGKIHSVLTDDADELPQFLRSYTTGCIEYLLYKAYDLDQKDSVADKHYKRFVEGKVDFVREITPRDQSGVKMIDLVEGTGREDDSELNYYY